jgi:tetratricopeptide (TPR) repeat protein
MKPSRNPETDPEDAARWEAVEEATELLIDGNPHDALYLLRMIVREDPRNPYAFYYIGTAMFEVGRFDAAVDAYEAALRLSPRYMAARVGLSHSLRIEGNLDVAIHHARKALEQVPGDGDALFALGLALASSKDRVGAVRALRAFLETHPELEVTLEAQAMLEKLGPLEEDDDN